MPCLGLDILEPIIEVSSRVGGEGAGEGDCRGIIFKHGWGVDGWTVHLRLTIVNATTAVLCVNAQHPPPSFETVSHEPRETFLQTDIENCVSVSSPL